MRYASAANRYGSRKRQTNCRDRYLHTRILFCFEIPYFDENRLMKWLRDIGVMLLLTGASVEQAHAQAFLNRAEPPVGSRVIVMPHEVSIWFTERIESAGSSIKVFDAIGKQIDKRDVHADPKNKVLLRVSLPVLAPGTYKVIWQVVSVDSHSTKGDFTFQFLPKATLPHGRQ